MSSSYDHSSQNFSLERISKLVSDLEQELDTAPADSPRVQALKDELVVLKRTLASPEDDVAAGMHKQLHSTHGRLDDLVASVEGEVLKDTPYLTELGRILGMI